MEKLSPIEVSYALPNISGSFSRVKDANTACFSPAMPPTRLSQVFADMSSACPREIAAYGRCVLLNAEALSRGLCEREFQDLKGCFRSVRRKRR